MSEAENKQPHDVHDRGYKLLLSFTKIFQQLLEGYVEGDWKARLDYARSQRIDKSFILKGFEKQESDILYKVPLQGKEENEVFLYVLIEQQSTVDYTIAFRVLVYLVEIWTDFYKNADENLRRQKGFRFPPVFPIVLYNGGGAWTAATSVKELVKESESFAAFLPNVRYHLIDIPRLDLNKLIQLGNSLAAVFLLEHEIESEEFEQALSQALSLVDQETNEELWKSVIEWICMLLKREFPEKAPAVLEGIDLAKHTHQEVHTMLETMPKKLMALGEQRGEHKGVKKSLVKVLRARFGSVSQSTWDEIDAVTTPEDLDVLLDCAAVKTLAEFQAALAQIRQR